MATFSYTFHFKRFICHQLTPIDDVNQIIKNLLYPLIYGEISRTFKIPTFNTVKKYIHHNWFENEKGIVFTIKKSRLTKMGDEIWQFKNNKITYTLNNYIVDLYINYNQSLVKQIIIGYNGWVVAENLLL